MSDYAITGRKRSGKSLFATYLIRKALLEGRSVATNFDLSLDKLLPTRSRAFVVRLPDHPTGEALTALGPAYPGPYDERKSGLLILDECSHFLGARTWNEQGRSELLKYLSESGKLGWEVYYLVQSIEQLDSLVRASYIEAVVRVRNMSKVSIPFIGTWLRRLGLPHYLPRFHLAVARLGLDPAGPVSEKWLVRDPDLFQAYDTTQRFGAVEAASCYLSPWHLVGRYLPQRKPIWHWPIAFLFVLLGRIALATRLCSLAEFPASWRTALMPDRAA